MSNLFLLGIAPSSIHGVLFSSVPQEVVMTQEGFQLTDVLMDGIAPSSIHDVLFNSVPQEVVVTQEDFQLIDVLMDGRRLRIKLPCPLEVVEAYEYEEVPFESVVAAPAVAPPPIRSELSNLSGEDQKDVKSLIRALLLKHPNRKDLARDEGFLNLFYCRYQEAIDFARRYRRTSGVLPFHLQPGRACVARAHFHGESPYALERFLALLDGANPGKTLEAEVAVARMREELLIYAAKNGSARALSDREHIAQVCEQGLYAFLSVFGGLKAGGSFLLEERWALKVDPSNPDSQSI